MDEVRSDALVFFGATGDLAYKKIFPALHAMVRRGLLDVLVVGVAKSDWNLETFVPGRAIVSRRMEELIANHSIGSVGSCGMWMAITRILPRLQPFERN